MINCDDVTKENISEHNPNGSWILDHPFKILIDGSSDSRETDALFNITKQQDDDYYGIIDKIYLFVKD